MLPPPLNQPLENSLRLKEKQSEDISVKDIFPLWLTEKTAIEQAIKACDGNIPESGWFLRCQPINYLSQITGVERKTIILRIISA